jgi:Type IX secretion system protein PorV
VNTIRVFFRHGASAALLILSLRGYSLAASGTEAASFLDIPVGGRPAALGASYSALASDAYAPVWNPAGLGFLNSTQVAGMHLSYLESINYEFASFVHPLSTGRSLGVAAQYLSPGDIPSTDFSGISLGTFSGHYGAYSLAYGQTLSDQLSLGLTGKIIDAKISDVSAQAYAFDAGTLYQATDRLRLAAVVANVGTKLTFIDQHDSLPAALRLGGAYTPVQSLDLTAEGVYAFTGLTSAHLGVEFMPSPFVSLRTGFRSDTTKNLSALAGFSTGIGLHYWGQEFDYAWVPLGDLGNTQYFSLVLRFGAPEGNMKNMRSHAKAEKQDPYPYRDDGLDKDMLGTSL